MTQRNNLEFIFPKLRDSKYKIIGSQSTYFNCLSRANADRMRWWHYSEGVNGIADWRIYWPLDIPRNGRIETILLIFQMQGFSLCSSAEYEPGFTKVAIYSNIISGQYAHVAIMENASIWTSKLGKFEEIEHETLGVLEGGSDYGVVVKLLKRPLDCNKML